MLSLKRYFTIFSLATLCCHIIKHSTDWLYPVNQWFYINRQASLSWDKQITLCGPNEEELSTSLLYMIVMWIFIWMFERLVKERWASHNFLRNTVTGDELLRFFGCKWNLEHLCPNFLSKCNRVFKSIKHSQERKKENSSGTSCDWLKPQFVPGLVNVRLM